MSSEIEAPFGNFCCTCRIRDNEADTEFQSIFDAIPNTDKRISDLLKILTECNIVKDMSNRVCGKCVQRICGVYEFQQMYLRAQLKYRQLTEEKKYSGEIVASSDLILYTTIEESDPLKEDDCMSEESVEADGNEDATQDLRPVSSLSSDDDFNWPSEEEKCETESKEPTIDIQTNKRNFECDICLRTFMKAKGLHDHKRVVHPPSTFVCSICGKGYKAEGHFIRHKLKHKSEAKEHNAEKEENQENLSGEQQEPSAMQTKEGSIRTPLEPFTCEICHKVFSTRGTLRRHKLIHTGEAWRMRKPSTCEMCHKVFSSKSHLNAHKRIHTGERKYLCKECGKSFISLSSFAHHEKVHAGLRQYECPFCPKKFNTNSHLITHKLIHSDIRPHVCDVCGASFKVPYDLKKHKLYHGEKSVKCEQCDMRFYVVGSMRSHMLIHTGEKPYKCKYCDRAFNQNGCLMKHLKVHLGNNVYRCELCPMGFPTFKERQTHFASHKNEDEATRKKNAEALADYERSIMECESNLKKVPE